MCDTILASPQTTAGHSMLFGKNSDRQRNEAQTVELLPRAEYGEGAQVRCTFIAIPQVERTHAVLIGRPFWGWGAEMGANEHGVVIGNEGLRARTAAPREAALTGMDLLRLALERAGTAAEAVEVITKLLERHGQGGDCGHLTPAFYNNGFMIADAETAFVLETVDRDWVVERVHDVRAISNVYSITQPAERASAGMSDLLRRSGWKADELPRYADLIADPGSQHIGNSAGRRARATAMLSSIAGHITPANLMAILRDHDDVADTGWHPRADFRRTICLHACAEKFPAQTTASMVSELRPGRSVHWITGTAAPCTSIFKPMLMDVPLPPVGPLPTDRSDSRSLWWRHERLHRAAIRGDFPRFLKGISQERDALEKAFRTRIEQVVDGGTTVERMRVVDQCWQEASDTEERWLARFNEPQGHSNTDYDVAWSQMSRFAGLEPTSGENA